MAMTRRQFIGVTAGTMAAAAAARAQDAPKLKVGIIGDTKQGGYGHDLHVVWKARPDVSVVALADPDEAGRAKRAEEAGALRTYADYAEMLEKEHPDIVTIAPRCTNRHREYLTAAAHAGAHGFMEKPLADNLVDADAMITAIQSKNLKWTIAFNFRVHPIVAHVRKLVVDQGLIGDVLEIRGRGKEDHRAGGEDLLVLGVHNFDIMRDILGNPAWCAANILTGERPAIKADAKPATEPIGNILGDRIWATFGFPKGVVGHFASTRNEGGKGERWGIDICGTKGVIALRLDTLADAAYLPDPAWCLTAKQAQWQPLPDMPACDPKPAAAARYAPIIDDLIAAINEDRQPLVSLQDGRDALEMVQAVYAAHLAGGRIDMPLKDRIHPLA